MCHHSSGLCLPMWWVQAKFFETCTSKNTNRSSMGSLLYLHWSCWDVFQLENQFCGLNLWVLFTYISLISLISRPIQTGLTPCIFTFREFWGRMLSCMPLTTPSYSAILLFMSISLIVDDVLLFYLPWIISIAKELRLYHPEPRQRWS